MQRYLGNCFVRTHDSFDEDKACIMHQALPTLAGCSQRQTPSYIEQLPYSRPYFYTHHYSRHYDYKKLHLVLEVRYYGYLLLLSHSNDSHLE